MAPPRLVLMDGLSLTFHISLSFTHAESHCSPFLLLLVSSPLGRICFDLLRHLPPWPQRMLMSLLILILMPVTIRARCNVGMPPVRPWSPSFRCYPFFFIFFTYGNRMFGRTNVSRIQSLISFSSFSNGIQDMLPYLENCVTTKSSHCRREMSCFILFTLVPSIFETGF